MKHFRVSMGCAPLEALAYLRDCWKALRGLLEAELRSRCQLLNDVLRNMPTGCVRRRKGEVATTLPLQTNTRWGSSCAECTNISRAPCIHRCNILGHNMQ